MKKLNVLLTIFASCTLFQIVTNPAVGATSGSDFRAGRIITDATFYDPGSMSVGQIQDFINAKLPSCDTWGQQMYSSSTTRAQYASSKGVSTPFTCLKDFRTNSSSEPYQQGICNGYTATNNQSAAEIIYYVAQSCGISPKIILILLQKEQALLSDDWPWPIQYRSATGFACPDTASCDTAYYGFFKQVYYGVRQYKIYAAKPYDYNHLAGYTNTVRYHPNSSCGSSSVYIESQATAGLYNYTPYQPNQAALNNLYGEGDGCSAYGNRNFWRMFNDWFGSSDYASFLLRSPSDATVYLVVDNKKYSISDGATVESLYPLGNVGYASDQYLASKINGGPLKRLIRSINGTVYFYDAGIKLAFTSCAQVETYGYQCGDSIILTDIQINSFSNGPNMTAGFMSAQDSKKYYVNNGQKREVYDETSVTSELGSSLAYNRFNSSAVNNLGLGSPVIRNGVAIRNRDTGRLFIYQTGTLTVFNEELSSGTALKSVQVNQLDDTSLAKLNANPVSVQGYVSGTDGSKYIIGKVGKLKLNDPTAWADTYATVPDELLAKLQLEQPLIGENALVKNASSGTVYLLEDKAKRPISSWSDVLALTSAPVIITLPDYYINNANTAAPLIAPGSLAKTPNSGTVYMTDGTQSLVPLTSFEPALELRSFTTIRTISDNNLSYYAIASSALTRTVKCNNEDYLSIGTKIYNQADLNDTGYQISAVNSSPLDLLTCNQLTRSNTKMEKFVNVPDGTIYYLNGGEKHPISSYQTYVNLGGSSSNTIKLNLSAIRPIPTGSTL